MACGALAEELDAVLSGRGWEVQERYDSAPVPAHPVRVRKTACYIVLAVLLNDQNEVLMMQEAKHECYGTWYLPAGRMEPNETILEAMKREVKEETGLECEPLTLLAVEERGSIWIRYVFLARPTGASPLLLPPPSGGWGLKCVGIARDTAGSKLSPGHGARGRGASWS